MRPSEKRQVRVFQNPAVSPESNYALSYALHLKAEIYSQFFQVPF